MVTVNKKSHKHSHTHLHIRLTEVSAGQLSTLATMCLCVCLKQNENKNECVEWKTAKKYATDDTLFFALSLPCKCMSAIILIGLKCLSDSQEYWLHSLHDKKSFHSIRNTQHQRMKRSSSVTREWSVGKGNIRAKYRSFGKTKSFWSAKETSRNRYDNNECRN